MKLLFKLAGLGIGVGIVMHYYEICANEINQQFDQITNIFNNMI